MATKYLDDTGLTHFWQKIKGKSIPYATCSTAKATVEKEVTISGITALETGLIIAVKFTNTNTATNPTLKVNSLTAKSIARYGNTLAGTSAAASWNAGEVVVLVYDGTHWQIVNFNNTTYSAMSQSEMQTGTATTARNITAARLKEAVQYHALVKSVNGSTGDVTVTASDVGLGNVLDGADVAFNSASAVGVDGQQVSFDANGTTFTFYDATAVDELGATKSDKTDTDIDASVTTLYTSLGWTNP